MADSLAGIDEIPDLFPCIIRIKENVFHFPINVDVIPDRRLDVVVKLLGVTENIRQLRASHLFHDRVEHHKIDEIPRLLHLLIQVQRSLANRVIHANHKLLFQITFGRLIRIDPQG
ncbi:hypothetical protein D3C85_1511630 [compost metagenome]